MKQTGLESIQSNVFVPVFGKGIDVNPWFRHTGEFDAMPHYEQGLRLLRMSLELAAPQFLELGTCTQQNKSSRLHEKAWIKQRRLAISSFPYVVGRYFNGGQQNQDDSHQNILPS
jgi:hypothetical protein